MTDGYIKIPTDEFRDLERSFRDLEKAFRDLEKAFRGIKKHTEPGSGKDLWIDPVHGHPSNDGLSAGTSVRSWAQLIPLIEPGSTINMRSGLYRERLHLANIPSSRENPLRFRSEEPNKAVFSAVSYEGFAWEKYGSGIYVSPNFPEPSYGPWCGYAKERFLPWFGCFRDLHQSRANDIRMPRYGVCVEDGNLYVRLPGKGDPREETVAIVDRMATSFVELENCGQVVFERIGFMGHGNAYPVAHDGKTRIGFRECATEFGRSPIPGAVPLPGYDEWASEVVALNGGDKNAVSNYLEHYAQTQIGSLVYYFRS